VSWEVVVVVVIVVMVVVESPLRYFVNTFNHG